MAKTKDIRLFENNFLEAMTHVHPAVPLCLWGPVALVLIVRGAWIHGYGAVDLGLMVLAAAFAWTFAEYAIHRFVFHFPARSRVGKYLVHLFHGVHHDAPNDRTRLLMPPAGAILIFGCIFGFFRMLLPHPWVEPFCGFFIIGYLCYDYTHYAVHFWPMKGRIGRSIKRNHLLHHFQEYQARFGVSSPLWDWVFGTRGKISAVTTSN